MNASRICNELFDYSTHIINFEISSSFKYSFTINIINDVEIEILLIKNKVENYLVIFIPSISRIDSFTYVIIQESFRNYNQIKSNRSKSLLYFIDIIPIRFLHERFIDLSSRERFHPRSRIQTLDRAMIKNGRGVTIRALADEVFSIRIGTLRDRLHATKGPETVYWLFRLSCQSRYRVTDPTSQSVSQRIVLCALPTKARNNPRYATSIPMFPARASSSSSLSLSLCSSLSVHPVVFFRSISLSPPPFLVFYFFFLVLTFSSLLPLFVVLTNAFLHRVASKSVSCTYKHV